MPGFSANVSVRSLGLASLLLCLGLSGCSTKYVISKKELARAQSAFSETSEVIVKAVKEDKSIGSKRTWMRLRADDYLTPPGDGESFQLAGISPNSLPVNATFHQKNLGPALFWPGFGIAAGTSLLMIIITLPAYQGERWDLAIPVYGYYIGGNRAMDYAIHACDGKEHPDICGAGAFFAGFGGVLSYLLAIVQGASVGLMAAGTIMYIVGESREVSSGGSAITFEPILNYDDGAFAGLLMRF